MACIYGLVDPREPNRVRYVGKAYTAVGRFAGHLEQFVKRMDNPRAKWIASLRANGLAPDMVLLERVQTNCKGRELHWFTLLRARGEADLNIHPPKDERDFPGYRRRDAQIGRPHDAPLKPRKTLMEGGLDPDRVHAILDAARAAGHLPPLKPASAPLRDPQTEERNADRGAAR